VKKSRALSTPAEVDENDNDEEEFVDALENEVPTPSPHPSPPHETKIRQLSQGADDISWRDGQSVLQESADTAPAPVAPDNAATPDVQAQIGTTSVTTAATISKLQNQPDIVEFSAPEENVTVKAPIDETAATSPVEHVAAPPPAAVPTAIEAIEEVQVPATTSAMPVPQSGAQYTHKIDNQTSSVPLAEARADSNPQETKCPTPPLSEADCATKRPREDEDGDLDPNPREAKRASPPPEKEKEKEKKERPAKKKSGSDALAQGTPASPRSNPTSAFVGCPCLDLFLYANIHTGWWRLPCICIRIIALRSCKRSQPLRLFVDPH
jgi:Ran-binding protein 3